MRTRCVLLGDEDAPGASARERAIAAAGAELVATIGRWSEFLATVVDEEADVAVVDLSLTGGAGVRAIAAVRVLAPRCRVVVISELRGIDLAAVEAGAVAVVDPSDPRDLTAALRGGSAVATQA